MRTSCKLPCEIVSILDAGVHPKAAGGRETVRCIARQKRIAHLQPLHAAWHALPLSSPCSAQSRCSGHSGPFLLAIDDHRLDMARALAVRQAELVKHFVRQTSHWRKMPGPT